jgi:hypothetical protein
MYDLCVIITLSQMNIHVHEPISHFHSLPRLFNYLPCQWEVTNRLNLTLLGLL